MLKVSSFQIAENIDVKQFKAVFAAEITHADNDELFYEIEPQKFIYVFKYGIVSFLGNTAAEMTAFIELIKPYCRNIFDEKLSEHFDVELDAPKTKLGYNKIALEEGNIESFRLIMLNVSQSVALDYYYAQTTILLQETNHHIQTLERKGTLDLSGKHLKQYIGKTLNLKNKISENLYIFDSPDETWEDEALNRLDQGLKRTFDLQSRFKTIQEGLQITKENLELFKDLLQYRNSTVLEWIIIILIFVEVANLLFEKVFK